VEEVVGGVVVVEVVEVVVLELVDVVSGTDVVDVVLAVVFVVGVADDDVETAGNVVVPGVDVPMGGNDVGGAPRAEPDVGSPPSLNLAQPRTPATPAASPPRTPLRNCLREEGIVHSSEEMSTPRSPSACRSISGLRTVTVTAA
jgi:hypothetical protein